jgi:hypothetical protein
MFPDGLKNCHATNPRPDMFPDGFKKTVKQQIPDRICFLMGLKNLSSNKSPTGKPSSIHVGPKAEWRVYQLIAERQPSESYSRPYND